MYSTCVVRVESLDVPCQTGKLVLVEQTTSFQHSEIHLGPSKSLRSCTSILQQ